MGIGHIAVGLGLKRVEPQVNVAALAFAALLPDWLLGILVLLGLESVHVPAGYASMHYLTFTFPYSHSLAGSALLSLLTASLAFAITRRYRVAALFGSAVLSHFFLDALVHVPEMPVAGPGSAALGLGLWNHLAAELALESLMVAAGLALYLTSTTSQGRAGRYGMAVLVALLTVVMVGGQAAATVAPPPFVLAVGWIVQPVAFSAMMFWLDRQRSPRRVSGSSGMPAASAPARGSS